MRIFFYINPPNVSVQIAAIIAEPTGKLYFYTFMDPSTGANVTCLIHFRYDHDQPRIPYNVRQVHNYPLTTGQRCTCSFTPWQPTVYSSTKSLFMATLTLKLDSKLVLLYKCSVNLFSALTPYFDRCLPVDCSSLC